MYTMNRILDKVYNTSTLSTLRSVAGSVPGFILVHVSHSDKHTCMHMNCFPSLMHATLKPNLSLTIGGTLSRQASAPCQRQHFASRPAPSSTGSTPQPDDCCADDPTGIYVHTHHIEPVSFVFRSSDTFVTSQAGVSYWTGTPGPELLVKRMRIRMTVIASGVFFQSSFGGSQHYEIRLETTV